MSKLFNDITIEWEKRLCSVDDKTGYFHCWEHWADVVNPSPMIGGTPGGQISQVFGIVEFVDGVKRIDPSKIHFIDEENQSLKMFIESVNDAVDDILGGEKNENC